MKNCPLKNELLSALKCTGDRDTDVHGGAKAEISATDSAKGVVRCSNGAVCCAFLALMLLTEGDEKLKRELREILK